MDNQASAEPLIEDWTLRPWVLAGILALAGFLIHFLWDGSDPAPLEAAGTAFLFFGSLCAAFSVGPKNVVGPAIFAGLAGLVMGGLAYNTVAMDDALAGEEFAFAAGVFATVIALPLFQADFHRTRLATDYRLTHFHVWTDAVSAAGAFAFTGLSWLMLFLLDALFDLVGINFIDMLIDEAWFGWAWSGGAFGAALGVLRNNLKVIGALQKLVLIVLSMLAIPLAAALVVFLVALLASGGQALWDTTEAATPILLVCALGSFVLSNAVIRDDDEARSSNRFMQIAALVLAAGIFPLAIFAAISMGIRIDQHGLTPERIWALVTIVIATAFGLAYWAGLARGRWQGWAAMLRRANLNLAVASSALALFLALPILDFGGISARNQVARLDAGAVSPEDFDYAALRWDFGDAGRAVLDDLVARDGTVAELAAEARDAESRPYAYSSEDMQPMAERRPNLAFAFDDPALAEAFERLLREQTYRCTEFCTALDLGDGPNGKRHLGLVELRGLTHFLKEADGKLVEYYPLLPGGTNTAPVIDPDAERVPPVVEVRKVEMRQVYSDDVPVGTPFE
jgi:hypothetical protein